MNDIDDNDDEWIPDWLMEAQKAEGKEMLSKYEDLCPGGNPEEFSWSAMALVVFDDLNSPSQDIKKKDQGFQKTINEELASLRKSIERLSPATRDQIILREINDINDHQNTSTKNLENLYSFRQSDNNCLAKLERYIKEDFHGRKVRPFQNYLFHAAAALWEKHGGTVTSTERTNGFVALLDTIIDDKNEIIDSHNKLVDDISKTLKDPESVAILNKFSSGMISPQIKKRRLKFDSVGITKRNIRKDKSG